MRPTLLLLLALAACTRAARPDTQATPKLTLEDATALVPDKVEDREGWALDVLTALDAHHVYPDVAAVCEVMAVIEQESGFHANPAVPGIAKLARGRLESYASRLGPLGPPALSKLLEGRAPNTKATFEERLDALKTERDLDLLFRDLLAYYENAFSGPFKILDLASQLSGRGGLEALNPITTAGSMQVSVRFAMDLSEKEDLDEAHVRDRLYTRSGGVFYGSARLLGYDAGYDRPLYRFADYNAGVYTARNAAFQEQLAAVTERKLTPDGDLRVYDKTGDPADVDSNTLKALLAYGPAHELSERRIRKDVAKEKTREFEDTDTYKSVRASYRAITGKAPDYARLPDVAIKSPKMSKERSTAWFAQSVDGRYQKCLARAR